MNDDVQALRSTLGKYDPAASVTVDDAERMAIRNRVPTGEVTKNTSFSRYRRISALSAAAAFLAVISIQVYPGLTGENSAAFAATPTPLQFSLTNANGDAKIELLHLAATAGSRTNNTGSGPVAYVKTQGWYLGTRVDGKAVDSAVLPTLRETWRNADGSGRIRTQWAQPDFPTADSEKAWEKDGKPGSAPDVDDSHMQANEMHLTVPNPSSDATALTQQISASHPSELGSAEQFVAIADLYREQPVTPSVSAAVLNIMAGMSDIRSLGNVTDRAGRAGVGFAVDSAMSGLPTEYVLIFDPATGSLLSEEQMLTSDPGKLDVKIPAVTSYTLFLTAQYVASTQP